MILAAGLSFLGLGTNRLSGMGGDAEHAAHRDLCQPWVAALPRCDDLRGSICFNLVATAAQRMDIRN